MEGTSSRSFNELYDKFEEVYNRLTLGRRDMKAFHEFIVLRQAAEERYHRDLEAAVKKAANPSVNCSLSTCYTDAKDAGSQISKQHQQVAVTCKDMGVELDKAIRDIKVVKTKLHEHYQRLLKDKEGKKTVHAKARAAYEDTVKRAEMAMLNFTAGKSQSQNDKALRKLEDAVQTATRDLDRAHKSYVTAVRECQAAQEKFESETASMLLQFEELEKKRLATFEDIVAKHTQVHVFVRTAMEQLAAFLVKSQSGINLSLDVHAYIVDNYTGQAPEPHVEYRPKTSEIIPHYGDAGAVQDSNAHLQQTQTVHSFMMRNSGNAAAASYTPGVFAGAVGAGAGAGGVQPSSSSAAPASATSAGAGAGAGAVARAVALYDFVGQEAGDLSFRAGDVVELLVCPDADEWWQGQLHGALGTFPRDYVRKMSPEESAGAGAGAGAGGAPAGGSSSASDFGTLFGAGAGAGAGSSQPPSQAQAFAPPPAAAAAAAPPAAPAAAGGMTSAFGTAIIKKVKALYPFTGEAADELSFEEGDILGVVSEIDGWYEGENAQGRQGIFPCNYCEDV